MMNGVPFLYPDSFVYFSYGTSVWEHLGDLVALDSAPEPQPAAAAVQGGAGKELAAAATSGKVESDSSWTPLAGRSIYYGVLAGLPGLIEAPWTGVLLQSYCAAVVVAIAWREAVGRPGVAYLAAMAAFGLFTTFGIFASTAMPDVWAGLSILSVAVLVAYRHSLHRFDAVVLWAFVLFATLVHSSHLALLVALGLGLAVARLAGAATLPWSMMAKMGAIAVVAVLLSAGGKAVLERAAGKDLLGLPFFTAHLVDGGPGTDFARDRCPEVSFAVCERADQLPVEWREFLFRFSGSAAYQRRLVAEDRAFALATLRHDPLAVAALAVRDAVRQVAKIGLVTTPIRDETIRGWSVERSYSSLAERMRAGRLYEANWLYRAVSLANTVLVIAGLAGLAVLLLRRDRPGSELRTLLTVSGASILLNAAICGVLASPYDRFQARVAWLIPVLLVIALAHWWSRPTGNRATETPG